MLAKAETALVQALAAHPHIAKRTRGAGTLPKGSPEEMLRKYAADAPALYVMPGTFSVQSDAAVMRFVVAGVVRNVAGHAQARNGDGIDIGCDHLMTWAAQAIHGQNLGGANWSLTRGEMADDEMFDQIGVAAIELHFESSPVLLDLDVDQDGLDDFERFHGDMDHQTFAGPAEHAKWLQEPPDHSASRPDAQLDVSLPGPTESTTDA